MSWNESLARYAIWTVIRRGQRWTVNPYGKTICPKRGRPSWRCGAAGTLSLAKHSSFNSLLRASASSAQFKTKSEAQDVIRAIETCLENIQK